MTAAILQSELSSIIQETKKKHPEIRTAAEKSLNELKSLSITSEAQLSGDLVRRPVFVEPFILAAKSNNGKLASASVVCLQRLVASGAIPRDRLRDVLEAFRALTSAGLDSQLKILQSLPAILQGYQTDIQGAQLFLILEVCGVLTGQKAAVVSSTAAATFQQLVNTVFEKVSQEDERHHVSARQLKLDGQTLDIGPSAGDAFNVLNDLCIILEGGRPENMNLKTLSVGFILELLEGVLANAGILLQTHKEQIYVFRKRAVPAIVSLLSGKQTFGVSVRAMRVLSLLIRNHLDALDEDGEMVLSLLTYLLDPESGASWKRILSMEVFRGIYSDFKLLRMIFTKFDMIEGRKNILRDHMGAMVRLAAEKPALIGLSHQSTVPQKRGIINDANDEQASIEALGVAGIVGSAVSAEANVTGISTEWSVLRSSCLDQLDKSDPPSIPTTYIYSLVLGCLGTFAENLTRFIMPLSVPKESRSKRPTAAFARTDSVDDNASELQRADSSSALGRKQVVLLNPLSLDTHPQIDNIRTTASMIDACWPAFLATCSTFFYAALDGDFYHGLVRAFQKFTQVSGVLRLVTQCDAFLTTLGKAAVPLDALNFVPQSQTEDDEAGMAGQNGIDTKYLSVGSPTLQSPTRERSGLSIEEAPSTLNTRNLLCLRALLNLGIALGPTLECGAWSIILETLQQSDLVINISIQLKRRKATGKPGFDEDGDSLKTNLGAEIVAVQNAARKLFLATNDYPDEAFLRLLNSLAQLAGQPEIQALQMTTPSSPRIPKRPGRMHQASRSVSMSLGPAMIKTNELTFVLERLSELTTANRERLAQETPERSGWSIISQMLLENVRNADVESALRLRSSDLLNNMALEALKLSDIDGLHEKPDIQRRALLTLYTQLPEDTINQDLSNAKNTIRVNLHRKVLQALETILQDCGEDLIAGWSLVFDIINSVFTMDKDTDQRQAELSYDIHQQSVPVELLQSSFKSLQLLGSDYLGQLPSPCLMSFIVALHDFGGQPEDLNIALSSTTFFWNIVGFLQDNMDEPPRLIEASQSLTEQASSKDVDTAANALWITALLHLTELAKDPRDNVRDTAITLLLRIFRTSATTFSPALWQYCCDSVFLRLLHDQTSSLILNDSPSLERSTIDLVDGFRGLLIDHIDQLSRSSNFDGLLNSIFETLRSLLKHKSLNMSVCIFDATSTLIKSMGEKNVVRQDTLREAWNMWLSNDPVDLQYENYNGVSANVPNQAALTKYAECLLQICRVTLSSASIVDSSKALEACATITFHAKHPPYTSDTTKLSSEQEKVMMILNILYDKFDSTSETFFRLLFKMMRGPSIANPNGPSTEGMDKSKFKAPSLVAISGSVMQLLCSAYTKDTLERDVFDQWAVDEALECLCEIIECREDRDIEGTPALWRMATTSAITIVKRLVPAIQERQVNCNNATLNTFSARIVSIAWAVLHASPRSHSKIDEDFDISAFRTLHSLAIPFIGSSGIAEKVHRDYTSTLFDTSLLFEPFPDDMPNITNEDTSPLANLYDIRNGYAITASQVSRPAMAYVALSALFSLVSIDDTPTESPIRSSKRQYSIFSDRLALARAVSPYLILRCALPLKSFIADQPLRGLMPIPYQMKKEIEHIVNRFIDINSIDEAIPAFPANSSSSSSQSSTDTENPDGKEDRGSREGKSHLLHLYPLMLEFWATLRKVDGENKELWDVVERWFRVCGPGAMASADGAEVVKVRRNEWWR